MLPNGRHTLGPDTGTLQVRTSREGASAKAGHDLVMDVAGWEGCLLVSGDDVTLELSVDPRSLRVRWGFNGTTSLTDRDRSDISATIDAKVLRGAAIRFRSRSVVPRGEAFLVTGDLTIGTATSTITFELRTAPDGSRADAVATVTQSEFAIKPYSAMLGTLKVRDTVEIVARATLPRWSPPVVWEAEEAEEPEAEEPEAEEQAPAPVVTELVAIERTSEPVLVATRPPDPVAAPGEPATVAAQPAPLPHSGGLRLRWPR